MPLQQCKLRLSQANGTCGCPANGGRDHGVDGADSECDAEAQTQRDLVQQVDSGHQTGVGAVQEMQNLIPRGRGLLARTDR